MWGSIERSAKFVQNLTIIGGIFIGLASLVTGQLEKRVGAVEAFRKDYIELVRKDYLAFLSRWETSRVTQELNAGKQPDLKPLVLAFFKEQANEDSLLNFSEFFDAVWLCVQTKRCDPNTSIDLFDPQVRAIYETSAYYIEEKRKLNRDPSIGLGLEKLYKQERTSYLARVFVLP